MESSYILWKKKMAVLIGGTFLSSSISMTSCYGNLLPYVRSYYLANMDEINLYVDPLWVTTMYRCCFSLAMVFTSPLEHQFGKFSCIIGSSVVMSLSILGGYVAIKEPIALTLAFGVFYGLSVGVVYPLTLKVVLETMGERVGIAVGFTAIGSSIEAIGNIVMAYLVINPTNTEPDTKIGSHVYFSDPNLIDRVPYYFLFLGGVITLINILGLALIYYGVSRSNLDPPTQASGFLASGEYERLATPPSRMSPSEDCESLFSEPSTFVASRDYKSLVTAPSGLSTSEEQEQAKLLPLGSLNGKETRQRSFCVTDSDIAQILHTSENTANHTSTNLGGKVLCEDTLIGEEGTPETKEVLNGRLSEPICVDLTPKQILGTRQFWLAWLCCIGISHSFYVHVTLYKEYGQLYISNDALLASVAMLGMLANLVIRPNVGIFSDRFGVHTATFAMCASSALFMSLVVLGAHTSATLFAISSIIAFTLTSLQLMVLSLLTSQMFGKTHYATNMGLLCTGQLLLIFLEPVVIAGIIQHLGWDYVFLSASLSATLAAVAEMGIER